MNKLKIWGTSSLLVLAAFGATQAHAAGTASGTDVLNNVSVDFKVQGIAQTTSTASDTFKVDRKVNLAVATTDAAAVITGLGQTNAVLTYSVTNSSNATLDFSLAAVNMTGGTVLTKTDNATVSNIRIFVESGATPGYQVGEDLATHIDELPADSSKTVYVVSNMPTTGANDDIAGIVLTATAAESGAVGTPGAAVVETTTADSKTAVDTVFADAAGATDAVEDGKASSADAYQIKKANLSVAKTSKIVAMPAGIANSANNYAVPGATVEYCIAVNNATGGADATNINVSDLLPTTVTYVANSLKINGTVTGTYSSGGTGYTCNADGAAGGTFTDNTAPTQDVVAGTLNTVTSGNTVTLLFKATIN